MQADWNGGRTLADSTIASVLGAGMIGQLREVICWSQPVARGADPVSNELAFRIRGGQLLKSPLAALKLGAPSTVFGAGSSAPGDLLPDSMAIRYRFATHRNHSDFVLTWYDGQWAPPYESVDGFELSTRGALYLGQSGQLLDDGVSGRRVLLRDGKPPHELPRASLRSDEIEPADRTVEFCVVAGIASYRAQRALEWDSVAMCFQDGLMSDALHRQKIGTQKIGTAIRG